MKTYVVHAIQPTHYKLKVQAKSITEALKVAEKTKGSDWELLEHGAWQYHHVGEVFDE
jgi:hypothetical protein